MGILKHIFKKTNFSKSIALVQWKHRQRFYCVPTNLSISKNHVGPQGRGLNMSKFRPHGLWMTQDKKTTKFKTNQKKVQKISTNNTTRSGGHSDLNGLN